ncbi:leucine-rich repeat domain-containing protein [Larkinella humicola]|uniref:TIR domain-containing protein n=1 Tax=Larkinella humicola TaxID=2607654 RepID=A0A5N1JM85_9BACT|nr:leucine-rich repeat domain-containing protein [Larkinella humicola]KAA9357314.1 TIR domain-containing protein [Larkinella humicola]
MTPPEALQRINKCKQNRATRLNLSLLKLKEIPAEVSDLNWLTVLSLDSNQISEIKGLDTLTNLTRLSISSNQISEIKGLDTLTNLTEMSLSSNQISEIKGLDTLTNLTELSLDSNQISEIKGFDTLTNLTELYIYSNQISEIKGFDTLIKLTELYLYSNQINEIKGLDTLTNLTRLYLSSNQISEIKGLDTLTNLTVLSLSSNQISEIKGLDTLTNLTVLSLDSNQISEIKGLSPKQLERMEILNLDDNPIQGISLSDFSDVKGIIGYLRSKQTDTLVKNRRLKVNILGTGRIGKTQLLNFLKDQTFNEDDLPTHGTNQLAYAIPASDYRAKVWDFGGQSYHHGFHYLFLRRSDFYLVVWRNGHVQPSDYGYWLGTARAFAPESPLLLLQNCWVTKSEQYSQKNPGDGQPDEVAYPASERLQRYGLGWSDVFAIDVRQLPKPGARETYFLNELHHRMRLHADSFGEISEKWVNVAERLETEPLDAIYQEKTAFQKKYAANFDEPAFEGLLNFLEFTGTILYFRDRPLLKNYVFANPPRLSEWIFQLVRDKSYPQQQTGKISRKEIQKVHRKEKTDVFFALMDEFRLIFEQPHRDEHDDPTNQYYIIPQFLPEYKHSFKQVLLELLPFTFSLQFPDFIHEGRIFQFIAAYGKYAKDNTGYWKYGLLFGYETNRQHPGKTPEQRQQDTLQVLVYYLDELRQLMVHIEDGKGRSEVAREIFDYFVFDFQPSQPEAETPKKPGMKRKTGLEAEELDEKQFLSHLTRRNRDAKDLKTVVYLSTNRPYFIDVVETMQNIEAKNYFGTCVETRKRIPLNFMAINLLSKDDNRKLRIFFSYSHKDEVYRKELDVHMAMLKRSGRIETWYDREIKAGEEWNDKIKEQLELADIALLMISADFLHSDYIWEQELGILRKRLEQKDGIVVIPIFTRPCDTTDFDMMRFQGGQRDHQSRLPWISSSSDKDEVYSGIVSEIRKTINSMR